MDLGWDGVGLDFLLSVALVSFCRIKAFPCTFLAAPELGWRRLMCAGWLGQGFYTHSAVLKIDFEYRYFFR
jgi:hypothetical protein